AKRKEKKKQLDGTHKGDEVPAHTPSRAVGTTTTSVSDKTANDECCGQQQGPWVVRSTDRVPTTASSERRRQPGELESRLSEFQKTVIIRDKSAASNSEQASDAQVTRSRQAAAGSSSVVSGRKRQSWAMERNSVKRFLKKVPMLPSLEPVPVPEAQDVQLKPILRKRSAYKGGPVNLKSLPKPLGSKPAKRKTRTLIGRHAGPSFTGTPSTSIKL
ncbi:hypothetical protein H4R20_006199, partial [Coemansia guatemalensis]